MTGALNKLQRQPSHPTAVAKTQTRSNLFHPIVEVDMIFSGLPQTQKILLFPDYKMSEVNEAIKYRIGSVKKLVSIASRTNVFLVWWITNVVVKNKFVSRLLFDAQTCAVMIMWCMGGTLVKISGLKFEISVRTGKACKRYHLIWPVPKRLFFLFLE